jgi:hypothetical protein
LEIIFDLPHVFHPEASQEENALVLEALLECLTSINMIFKRFHSAPELSRSGVRYAKTQKWLSIPALYRDGLGDCKSLTCAQAADFRAAKIFSKPVFRFMPREDGSGILDFHILNQTSTGFVDPSKDHGMPHSEIKKFGMFR